MRAAAGLISAGSVIVTAWIRSLKFCIGNCAVRTFDLNGAGCLSRLLDRGLGVKLSGCKSASRLASHTLAMSTFADLERAIPLLLVISNKVPGK